MGNTMSSDNIFTTLAKYNSAIDENYLTESFTFVINTLLHRERPIGINILNQLCVKNDEFSFNTDEVISVSTQETTEQGIPDIKISSPDKLIYIEVKHDSPLGYKQLERYKRALEPSMANIKHVVLLTRFMVDFGEEERPYKHARWYEIYNWLSNARTRIKDPICVYLIDSFNSFLEVKQMSLQKVSWEYINGVPAFNNLITMIEVAIQSTKIPIHGKSAGWDYKGFWLKGKEYWCGVNTIDNPLIITFELIDKTKYNKELLEEHGYEVRENVKEIWFRLSLEKIYFFSLDKDKQLEEITKFIKQCHENAERIRIQE